MAQKMNPFPGLRPFEMQEKYLFFGREDQTVELLKRLGQARFMAVVGTSGSGKSSLVRAGLLPELHGGTMTDAGSSWEIAVMRPGGDPLTNLAKSLEESGIYDTNEDGYYRHLRAMLGRSTMGLIEAVSQSSLEKEDNLLIVVDQFEEIFRFRSSSGKHAEEAANFISLLLEATQQTSKSIFVTITMRSDFLGDCSQFRGLAEAVNEGEYLIPRLNRNQRRLAIEGPVKVGGKQIEARLVQQLLNDIGDDPDQLPILQHALMRTWEYHEKAGGEGTLDLDHYEATGGMKEALSRHADEVYEELQSEEERIYCQRIFKALTERVSGGRGIRRPMALSELAEVVGADDPNKLIPVIEAYRAAGRTFLMPPDSIELGPKIVIDISHESLMRVWQHLVGWVDEESQSARIYRRLADTAQLYRENKAGLYRDPDLQISLSWRDQNNPTEAWADRYYPGYNEAMAFLDESYETAIAEEKAKEEARKRELDQARRLAEEERRSKSLWQKLVWTFGVAVIAITVGLINIINSRATIIESRATIRDNLSRVSLKEANRLANSNQQDEAIALLAKTIDDNPDYSEAGIRLMSLLEHTAFPSSIKAVHSMDDNFQSLNNGYSLRVYPRYNIFHELGVDSNNLYRYRLISLDNSEVVNEWQSNNRLTFGRLINNGECFSFCEENSGTISKMCIYNIINKKTMILNFPKSVRMRFFSDDETKMLVRFEDNSFSVYSVLDGKLIAAFETIDTEFEELENISLSPSGNLIALGVSLLGNNKKTALSNSEKTTLRNNKKTTIIRLINVNKSKNNENVKIIKTYYDVPSLRNISFTKSETSIIATFGTRFFGVRICDLINIENGSSVNLIGGLEEYVSQETELFNDGTLAVAIGGEGGIGLAKFPFDQFSFLRGHKGRVRSIDVSNDGMVLASGSDDRTVRFWSTQFAEQISIPIRFDNAVQNVVFNSEGDLYVVVDESIFLVEAPLRKTEQISYPLQSRWENESSYSSSQDKVYVMNNDGLSSLDFKNRKVADIGLKSNGYNSPIGRVYPISVDWEFEKISFIEERIVDTNLVVKVFGINENSIINEIVLPENTKSARLNSRGSRLAYISTNNVVSLMNTDEEKIIGEGFNIDKKFTRVVPVGDGSILYAGAFNTPLLEFYDATTGGKVGKTINIRTGPRTYVYYLSKLRKYVVLSSMSSSMYLLDKSLNEFTEVDLGQEHQSHSINNLQTIIAVGTEDGNVIFYDTIKGANIGSTLRHDFEVEDIVFSPVNDRYVFTYMDGGLIYGWDRVSANIFLGPVSSSSGRGLYIDNSGTALTARSGNRFYRVSVQTQEVGVDYSSWLPNLANSMIGYKLNNLGGYVPYQENFDSNNVDYNENIEDWISWLKDTSGDKKVSPIDNSNVSDVVLELSKSDSFTDLHKALLLSPSNANLLSDYAYHSLTGLGIEEKNIRQVEFFISRAREMDSDSSHVFFRSAQIEQMLNNQMDSLKFISRAIELDTTNTEYSTFKKNLLQNN